MIVVISSGHGKYVRGASEYIDEVNEARLVVENVAKHVRDMGGKAITYHDNVSKTQDENLRRIVDFHNSQTRDLDVSIHFNAYEKTSKSMGTECLYVSQSELAGRVAAEVAAAGELTNRGAKKRTDLYFLNNTEAPAILDEVCFVDSSYDVERYKRNFELICRGIAVEIVGEETMAEPSPPASGDEVLFRASGKCSWFGGPDDTGVDANEGLAFIYDVNEAPHLFLSKQPPNSTGLARRLNPGIFYIACRWDYDVTPKSMLSNSMRQALVSAGGRRFLAWPADWGPHGDTNRIADLSPGLMEALGIGTDDAVEVVYPAGEDLYVA